MRIYSFVPLASSVLLASGSVASNVRGAPMTAPNYPAEVQSGADSLHDIPPKKRVVDNENTNDEERTPSSIIRAISPIKNLVKTKDEIHLEKLLAKKVEKTPKETALGIFQSERIAELVGIKKNSLVEVMCNRLDDKQVTAALLEAEKSNKLPESVLKDLMTQQFQYWQSKHNDDYVLDLLLGTGNAKTPQGILNGEIDVLERYITWRNNKKPDAKRFFGALAQRAGGEAALLSVISTHYLNPKATQLEDKLFKFLSEPPTGRKGVVRKLFEYGKMEEMGVNLLNSPALNMLERFYLRSYHLSSLEPSVITKVAALKKVFDNDDQLNNLIFVAASGRDIEIKRAAQDLRAQVFKTLDVTEKYRPEKKYMFKVPSDHAQGKQAPPSLIEKLSPQMEDKKFKYWQSEGGDDFVLQKITWPGGIFNGRIDELERYITWSNSGKPDDKRFFRVLAKAVGGEARLLSMISTDYLNPEAMRLEEKLFKFLSEPPTGRKGVVRKLFEYGKMEDMGVELVNSPALNMLERFYLRSYHSSSLKPNVITKVVALKEAFKNDDKKLIKLLEVAASVPDKEVKSAAVDLRDVLFKTLEVTEKNRLEKKNMFKVPSGHAEDKQAPPSLIEELSPQMEDKFKYWQSKGGDDFALRKITWPEGIFNGEIDVLERYITWSNNGKPDDERFFRVLTKAVGGEAALLSVISTKPEAMRLEKKLFKLLSEPPTGREGVVRKLFEYGKMDEMGVELLNSPALNMLDRFYLWSQHLSSPEPDVKTKFAALTKGFQDEKRLVELLKEATKSQDDAIRRAGGDLLLYKLAKTPK